MSNTKPRAIDLFSGCGGLSQGLKDAGYQVVAAIEADPLAMSTYAMNHKSTHRHLGDITKLKPEDLMRTLGLKAGELDLLAGCPPCQGYSTLRTMNGSTRIVDPMNDLVFQVTRFAKAFLPRALMIENVPGLLGDARLQKMTAQLKRLGYSWSADIFDASDFGVPQRRRRMILIATREGAPQFAAPDAKRKSVAQAIRKLSDPAKSRDPLHNYEVSRAKHVMEMIAAIPKDGGSRKSLAPSKRLACHKRQDGFRDVYGRMAWAKPGPTITGGCINPSKGRFLHPEKDRAITLREAALLQGFPKAYKFDMSRGVYSTAQMIGNAFPPPFAERHAAVLLETLGQTRRRRNRRV